MKTYISIPSYEQARRMAEERKCWSCPPLAGDSHRYIRQPNFKSLVEQKAMGAYHSAIAKLPLKVAGLLVFILAKMPNFRVKLGFLAASYASKGGTKTKHELTNALGALVDLGIAVRLLCREERQMKGQIYFIYASEHDPWLAGEIKQMKATKDKNAPRKSKDPEPPIPDGTEKASQYIDRDLNPIPNPFPAGKGSGSFSSNGDRNGTVSRSEQVPDSAVAHDNPAISPPGNSPADEVDVLVIHNGQRFVCGSLPENLSHRRALDLADQWIPARLFGAIVKSCSRSDFKWSLQDFRRFRNEFGAGHIAAHELSVLFCIAKSYRDHDIAKIWNSFGDPRALTKRWRHFIEALHRAGGEDIFKDYHMVALQEARDSLAAPRQAYLLDDEVDQLLPALFLLWSTDASRDEALLDIAMKQLGWQITREAILN